MQARAVALASSKGDLGVGGSLFYTDKKMSAAVDARHLWLAARPIPGYDDMSGSFTQMSATASYAVRDDVTLGLRINYAQQDRGLTASSIGPYADWRIWQEGERMLGVSVDMARTDGQSQGDILLNFTYRLGENGVTGSAGDGFGTRSHGPFGSVRAWHDHEMPSGEGFTYGGGISGDAKNPTVGGDADWRNRLGQVRGRVQQGLGRDAQLNYGGSFAMNAAQSGTDMFVGGNQMDASAVVVDTAGDTDASMKIFVNNMERGAVDVGGQRVIYLSPFHNYNIRIAPAENALHDYDPADRKVTLYPGNVTKLHWDVRKFYVISAKIMDENDKPLADALLEGSRDQIATGENGRLQAEISDPQRLRFTNAAGGHCTVALPQSVTPEHGVLVYPQPLVCRPMTN